MIRDDKKEDVLKHLTSPAAETYFASHHTKRSPLDSIAVPLFTNSETAAVTPLGLMRNFQWTINQ